MARPLWNSLWLKLFGPDGVATIDEYREALLNAKLGHDLADNGVLARIRSVVSAYVSDPEHADDQVPVVRLLGPNALLFERGVPVLPNPATDAVPHNAVVTDPEHAAAAGRRIATLSVAADPAIALGLIPIDVGTVNRESPFHEATRHNPLDNSWVTAWLFQQQTPMRIEWDADSLDSAASSLSALGPIVGSIELSGDFSSGFTLARGSMEVNEFTLVAGNNYNLIAGADYAGPGRWLAIDGHELGADDRLAFDGSAASVRLTFLGGAGNDSFFGGGSDDYVNGGGGGDTLTGGGGNDTFVYLSTSDSTGPAYDTLADFDPLHDRIDLPVTVTGLNLPIQSGSLSTASFNADLGAALLHLGAGYAAFFAPDAGDLAGKVFIVVDGNGVAGYQAGQDYVFALPATALADLQAHPTFFI